MSKSFTSETRLTDKESPHISEKDSIHARHAVFNNIVIMSMNLANRPEFISRNYCLFISDSFLCADDLKKVSSGLQGSAVGTSGKGMHLPHGITWFVFPSLALGSNFLLMQSLGGRGEGPSN